MDLFIGLLLSSVKDIYVPVPLEDLFFITTTHEGFYIHRIDHNDGESFKYFSEASSYLRAQMTDSGFSLLVQSVKNNYIVRATEQA